MLTRSDSSRAYFWLLAVLALLSLTSCNLPRSASQLTPTRNVTQAYETVAARLTQASAQTPQGLAASATPTGQLASQASATPTPTLALTPTLAPPLPSSTPQHLCDQAAPGNPIDVTIPDDTSMQPNQAFTKIWRLQNAGACSWTRSYSITYFSGEQMGALASVALPAEVAPGQSIDIAVDMIAPATAGKYQGNWKLRNASNALFGIGPSGSAPFWVRIIVVQTSTPTLTSLPPTPSVTPTATPAVLVSGTITLSPGDNLNLDTNQVNSGGEDLSYTSTAEGQRLLLPLGTSLAAIYGQNQPSLANCQAASLSASPIPVADTPIGNYLCYRTGQGLPGRARLISFNSETSSLTLDILTWLIP